MAASVAEWRGIDVTVVRLVFLVLGVLTPVAGAAYVAAWLLLPLQGEQRSIAGRALHDTRGLLYVAALAPLLVVALLLGSAAKASWLDHLAWSAFVVAAGATLVWRNGSDVERLRLRNASHAVASMGSGRRQAWWPLILRLLAGFLAVLGGLSALTIFGGNHVVGPIAAVGIVLAGVVVILGPWWMNMARQAVVERQARLRAEERAEMASRVHDSVLQTLTLIQRHADDPQRVAQLARSQERELRSWLFEGRTPGDLGGEAASVAAAVERIQSDVESAHGVRVEAVVVGDAPLDAQVEALLAAGREATVNAAKWSGAGVVSLFVEVEPDAVSMFVRDRGRGFERAAVGDDRRGITQSIEGRLARSGGSASIRTAPGEGTEVTLRVPRTAPAGRAVPWAPR